MTYNQRLILLALKECVCSKKISSIKAMHIISKAFDIPLSEVVESWRSTNEKLVGGMIVSGTKEKGFHLDSGDRVVFLSEGFLNTCERGWREQLMAAMKS